MKQSRIREWEENNGLINFNWVHIRRNFSEKPFQARKIIFKSPKLIGQE